MVVRNLKDYVTARGVVVRLQLDGPWFDTREVSDAGLMTRSGYVPPTEGDVPIHHSDDLLEVLMYLRRFRMGRCICCGGAYNTPTPVEYMGLDGMIFRRIFMTDLPISVSSNHFFVGSMAVCSSYEPGVHISVRGDRGLNYIQGVGRFSLSKPTDELERECPDELVTEIIWRSVPVIDGGARKLQCAASDIDEYFRFREYLDEAIQEGLFEMDEETEVVDDSESVVDDSSSMSCNSDDYQDVAMAEYQRLCATLVPLADMDLEFWQGFDCMITLEDKRARQLVKELLLVYIDVALLRQGRGAGVVVDDVKYRESMVSSLHEEYGPRWPVEALRFWNEGRWGEFLVKFMPHEIRDRWICIPHRGLHFRKKEWTHLGRNILRVFVSLYTAKRDLSTFEVSVLVSRLLCYKRLCPSIIPGGGMSKDGSDELLMLVALRFVLDLKGFISWASKQQFYPKEFWEAFLRDFTCVKMLGFDEIVSI